MKPYPLSLLNIRCHSYHGCLDEEALIGGEFRVDVFFSGDFSAAAASDDLSLTIDYVEVHRIVREQMNIRSKLIEHAANRILSALRERFPLASGCRVRITKFNPPVNGQLGEAVFEIASGE
jgi:dihydroneopterin aldolase